MHLLHVVPTYWPALRYGGTIAAVHGLCRSLAECGHRVTVLTTDADGRERLNVPLDRPVFVDGVEVRYFPVAVYRPCYSPAMSRALEAHVAAADVVHLHSVFLWPTWAAARVARRLSVPYIVSPRGMLVRGLIDRKNRLLKRTWIRIAEASTLKHAAGIHATSDVERRELLGLGLALPPVSIVENGVDGPPDDTTADDTGRGLGLPADEPIILYLGRLSWKKGLDRLVRALRHVRRGTLVIVGNDDEGYWPELRRLIEQEGVSDRVIYRGPAYRDAKWPLYRAAACFVLPSYSENFGNTVLEAMSAGCPVVVTPEVGAAALVQEANAGLVVTGDPTMLGNAISRIVDDSELHDRLGAAGLATVRERHTWARRARAIISVYEQVSSRNGWRAPGAATRAA